MEALAGDLPDICGNAEAVERATTGGESPDASSRFGIGAVRSAFSIALHMHQPLIPAGGGDPHAAAVISNLQHMLEHPEIPDAHNATTFLSCYQRMGEFIPRLVDEGFHPRVMLDYSGCLLHGLQKINGGAVIEALRPLARDPRLRQCVEWLGTAWGHAVAPSTPAQDFRLHVRAWQHHFASIFGLEALGRVRGFSPPEMALPNHPDTAYAFVKTLVDCGYRWVLVQEHTVENAQGGRPLSQPHLPHRLLAQNSLGQTAAITAVIKTQGSDTKLVGQMQPYYEAKGLPLADVGGKAVPQLAVQIGDGENGGVMMNEFPSKFFQVMQEASGSQTPPMNVTEYLEYLRAMGISELDFPTIRPIHQHRIWETLRHAPGREQLTAAIDDLCRQDRSFHMDGGSWTSDISWVRGYENVLGPMEALSAKFAEKMLRPGFAPSDSCYRNALFHLLIAQTSCFRYWGQGAWTDYARELCRRGNDALL